MADYHDIQYGIAEKRGNWENGKIESMLYSIEDNYDDKYDLECAIFGIATELYDAYDISISATDLLEFYTPKSPKMEQFKNELLEREKDFKKLKEIPKIIGTIFSDDVRRPA